MTMFYVNKMSGTWADTLLALGWAALVREVLRCLEKPSQGIVTDNLGDSFALTMPCELRAEELHSDRVIPFLEPLISATQKARQTKKGRSLSDGFDYEREREKQQQVIARRQKLPPELRTPEAYLRRAPELEEIFKDGPRAELPHYQAINILKVADTFNDLIWRWQSLTATQQWLTIGLLYRLFAQRYNDLNAALTAWGKLAKEQGLAIKAEATVVQLINPTTGKGANALKGNRLTNSGLEGFWLLELLKFKGFMIGAAPYVLKGSKKGREDRKTFVILPKKVELQTLASLMQDFRQVCWSSTAVKQDILAALRLAQVLVNHRRSELESRKGLDEDELPPIVSIAQGLDAAFYKYMGSAHAVMNVSTINVPSWFPQLHTLPQVERAELLLQEHLRVIRRIEGYQGKESGEALDLLRTYRDFLSGHDLRAFWRFAASYGSYLFRQRERERDVRRWLPQLTKKGLDIIAMQQQQRDGSLSAILANSGFQRIASAIREATVNAQRRRSQENDTTYEVRYGLGHELMRKIHQRSEFMEALNTFIFRYNAETAREEEKRAQKLGRHLTPEDYRRHRLRYPVTTADVDRLTELLDAYPIELVASMLVAYGYSRWEALKPEELRTEGADEDTGASEL